VEDLAKAEAAMSGSRLGADTPSTPPTAGNIDSLVDVGRGSEQVPGDVLDVGRNNGSSGQWEAGLNNGSIGMFGRRCD